MSRFGYGQGSIVGESCQDDLSRFLAEARDPDDNRVRGEEGKELLGPLDDRDPISPDQLFNPEIQDLGQASSSIGVHVVDREVALIVADKDKGWTRGGLHHTQSPHEPLEETGLPCSQLADARDDVTGTEVSAKGFTDPLSVLGALALEAVRVPSHTLRIPQRTDPLKKPRLTMRLTTRAGS